MSTAPEYEIADDDCVWDGEVWPEHDYPPPEHGGNCRRCDAEPPEDLYECNSCGEEYEDPAAVCCDDGEVVPTNDI